MAFSDYTDKYYTCYHVHCRPDYNATAIDENAAQDDMFGDNNGYLAVQIDVEILSLSFVDNTDRF
jgi:hypothetical protein